MSFVVLICAERVFPTAFFSAFGVFQCFCLFISAQFNLFNIIYLNLYLNNSTHWFTIFFRYAKITNWKVEFDHLYKNKEAYLLL